MWVAVLTQHSDCAFQIGKKTRKLVKRITTDIPIPCNADKIPATAIHCLKLYTKVHQILYTSIKEEYPNYISVHIFIFKANLTTRQKQVWLKSSS